MNIFLQVPVFLHVQRGIICLMFLEANNNGMDTRAKAPRIAIGAKFERVATGKEPLIKPVIPGFGNPKDNL